MTRPRDLQEILDLNPLWINSSAPLTEGLALLQSATPQRSYILVGAPDRLLGLVTERHALQGWSQLEAISSITVAQVMDPVPSALGLEDLRDPLALAEQMQRQGIRFWPVLDESDRVLGVIRCEQLLQVCLRRRDRESERQRQREFQFRMSIERSIPIGIAAADFSGHQIYVNDTFAQMLGWPPEELLGQAPPYPYWPPEEIENITRAFEEGLVQGRPPLGWELIFMRCNGERFPVRILDAPLQDGQGNLIGMMASIQDISAERQFLSQIQFQAKILEQVNDVVIAIDNDFKISYWNTKAVELYGFTQPEVLGRSLQDIVQYAYLRPEDEQIAMISIQEKGFWQGEVLHYKRSGEPILTEASVSALSDDQGFQIGLLAVIRDVTERKQMERSLQESESRFMNLVANIPGAVFRYVLHSDHSDQVLYMSPGCAGLWEVEAETVQASSQVLWDMMHPDDLPAVAASVLSSARTLEPWDHVWRIITPSGRLKWLQGAGQPQAMENGDVIWDSMILDITDRKRTELELERQLEQTRLLKEITQGIRKSLDLQAIFDAATTGIGRLLQVDQVSLNQYLPEEKLWRCLVEYNATSHLSQALGLEIPDEENEIAERLKRGEIVRINDTDQIKDKLNQQIAIQFPGAWLLIPIQVDAQTWGAISINQYYRVYEWQDHQIELSQQIVDPLAIAIAQAQLFKQLTDVNSELTYQVEVRNAELHTMITYERLLRLITDDVRSSLDEKEILQAAVRELTQVLDLSACLVCLLEEDQTHYRVAYECIGSVESTQGRTSTINPITLAQLHQGLTLYFTTDHPVRGLCTVVACPIWKQEQLFGFLKLVRPPRQGFLLQEIRLAEQVAGQCGIGIRQAHLYQSVQQQVDQLTELNELKEEFLNLVSHELRTPLTSMKMALTMLEVVGLTDPQIRYFAMLKQEWKKELDLVNNLLDLQRLESGKRTLELTQIELQDWIQELLAPFDLRCQDEGLALSAHLPDAPLTLITDAALLVRILSELLNNAIKYTPQEQQIQLIVTPLSPHIHFQIINTGVEIPADQLPHIFEKFHRVATLDRYQRGGTGLGLPLAKKGVELLAGQIQAHSKNNSTCFSVVLPQDLSQALQQHE